MYHIRCLGKNKNGSRCKKTFLSCKFSQVLTCDRHKDQKVDFVYGNIEVGGFKDVAKLIANYIDDPATFRAFSMTCRSAAKACHDNDIQKRKRLEFSKRQGTAGILSLTLMVLPNGVIIDDEGNFLL